MKNLNELAQELHEDLEKVNTLKTKGLRAYFKLSNQQKRQRNIREGLQRIKQSVEVMDRAYKIKKQERADRYADDYRRYGDN